MEQKYIIGIDLGTTNCAMAYTTSAADDEYPEIHIFPIPQLINEGEIREQNTLPSVIYLPHGSEIPKGSLSLPWDKGRQYVVGELAKKLGEKIPSRLVTSAKSWLCYPDIDRTEAILPWNSNDDIKKISPFEATIRILTHMKEAWNYKNPEDKIEKQSIFLTIPASFDAIARDLTLKAAKSAGLKNIVLLEEPQAAFYSWVYGMQDEWRKQVKIGDVVFVCDVGGGTTDFSLIEVKEEKGNLVLERLAVGEHILLGGDNMDLALASHIKEKLESQMYKIDTSQFFDLWFSSRIAKEKIFTNEKIEKLPIVLVGQSSKLISGTIKTKITKEAVYDIILNGFFERCKVSDLPTSEDQAGLQELGLNYASDTNILKYIAKFLRDNNDLEDVMFRHPTAILFNGGVFKTDILKDRIVEVLNGWLEEEKTEKLKVLGGFDLDLAVARGAANYGLVRQGQGVRIRAGIARTYYIGIESSMPTIPGVKPPLKILCVTPFGMEEGTELDVPNKEFGLVTNKQAEFRFFSSVVRKEDKIGKISDSWDRNEIEELTSVKSTLNSNAKNKITPVTLRSKVTEIGMLELWFISKKTPKQKWKLEFNVRDDLV